MYITRPVQLSDVDQFLEISKLTGSGFTSLSIPEKEIIELIETSVTFFNKPVQSPKREIYILVLEDIQQQKIIGMSAIKTGTGYQKPYFNFRIFKSTQYSSVANKYFDLDLMVLVNDFGHSSEICMLFVHPDYRSHGSGHLISQSRYMLIAEDPDRFNQRIISELRGVINKEGNSPFWNSVGQIFFDMRFDEADLLNANTDNQFIIDLMPKYPIYIDLLPDSVKEVIGKPHPKGVGALKLLEKEGFLYENVIDIFDAGPLVSCQKERIRTVKESFISDVKPVSSDQISQKFGDHEMHQGLISNLSFQEFRTIFSEIYLKDGIAYLKAEVYDRLNLDQKARLWVRK